jgi:hypothetical protein
MIRHIVFYTLLILVLLASCSKDQIKSRRLDGMWYERYINDIQWSEENKKEWRFTSGKKGEGTVKIIYFDYTHKVLDYNYEVSNGNLWLFSAGENGIKYKIEKLKKSELELVDREGRIHRFVSKYN